MSESHIIKQDSINFQKAKDGLWNSLQKHLTTFYEADDAFNKCIPIADSFPFDSTSIDRSVMEEYWKSRTDLRNLFIDETEKLESLLKTVRMKPYSADNKKFLYLLILGYMDILYTAVPSLEDFRPNKLPLDIEFNDNVEKFVKLKKLAMLNVKGVL